MQISKEELNRRLNSSRNLARLSSGPESVKPLPNTTKVVPLPPDKKEYNESVPVDKRAEAAADFVSGNLTQKEVAKKHGMTPNQVYGAVHSHDYSVTERTERNIERARELALDRLMAALGLVTDEKLENANLKDLSSAAANFSRIIDKTGQGGQRSDSVKLIVYAPQQREMKDFKFIDV